MSALGQKRTFARHEHDRHGAARLLQCAHGCAANGHDDIWRKRDQFWRIFAITARITGPPAILDLHVATERPAPFPQTALES